MLPILLFNVARQNKNGVNYFFVADFKHVDFNLSVEEFSCSAVSCLSVALKYWNFSQINGCVDAHVLKTNFQRNTFLDNVKIFKR